MKKYNYSVIIPTKNTPDLLSRALNSIPQRDDVQIIIVDDNSDSNKVDFNHYPGSDREHVQVIFNKDGLGAGHARNVGLKQAVGKWILFMDSDDLFSENFTRILDKYMDSDADVVFLNTKYVKSDNLNEEIDHIRCKDYLFQHYRQYHDVNIFKLCYTEPWGKLFCGNFLKNEKICFEETKVANDYLFSVMTGCKASKIIVDDSVFYIVTQLEGSLSYAYADSIEKVLTRLGVYKSVQIFLQEQGFEITPMIIFPMMDALFGRSKFLFIKELLKMMFSDISLIAFLQQYLPYKLRRIYDKSYKITTIIPSYQYRK